MAYQFNQIDLRNRPIGIELWIAAPGALGEARLRRVPIQNRHLTKQTSPSMVVGLRCNTDNGEDGELPNGSFSRQASAEVIDCDGSDSQAGGSTSLQSGTVSAEHSQREWPNTGAFNTNPLRNKPLANTTPFIQPLVAPTFVPWMSSSSNHRKIGHTEIIDDDSQAIEQCTGEVDAAAYMRSQTKATHLNRRTWIKISKFCRFDPTVGDPQATLALKGWNKQKRPTAYQFYLAIKMLADVCKGQIYNINATEMGLGKTAISTLTVYAHITMRKRYENVPNPKVPSLAGNASTLRSHFRLTPESKFGDLQDLVGTKPVVQHGATLIIVPTALVSHWAKEIKSFVTDKEIKIVVAHGGRKWTANDRRDVYTDCYHPLDFLKVGSPDLPDIEILRREGGEEFADDGEQKGGTTVQNLLDAAGANSLLWLDDWVVICGRDNAANTVGSNEKHDYGIKTLWALVVIDEFHQAKSPMSKEFGVLQDLKGWPSFLLNSATPYNLPEQIGHSWAAVYARYSRLKNVPTRLQRMKMGELSLRDRIDRSSLEYIPELSPEEQGEIEEASFGEAYKAAVKISKTIKKASVSSTDVTEAAEDDLTFDFGETGPSEEVKNLINTFAVWLKPHMIQFTGDLMWCPNEDGRAYHAMDIPPHSTFDISLTIEQRYQGAVEKFWKRAFEGLDAEAVRRGAPQFFGAIDQMNVVLLYPCLPELMEQNPDLAAELGTFTTNQIPAHQSPEDMKKTQLWKVMGEIHSLLSMRVVIDLIKKARDTTLSVKCAGHGRKIITMAVKPFNAYIFNMYTTWLAVQDREKIEWQPQNVSEEVVYINTSESDYQRKNRERFARFTCGNPDKRKYKDVPFLMNAVGSQVRTGLSLAPADVVVMLDGTYQPEYLQQQSGRVRRNALVQLNEHTWTFRLLNNAPFLQLGNWQSTNQASQAAIQNGVLAGMDTLIDE
ncbi:hypothetical protein KC330_g8250 [Hortaea werneckii]|nr:hypothetical protein KC330_g8250 [Hortaea werneckii]